ncbi:membrane associated rhomboid family serine protease [Nocardioides daedukensis]|uniref:Membrane associated rhomboid family serine protease n=1 Tax=Nocardioides daedukensis TaxID=634462 RepID=A0A7Y9UQA9_9ACTN|nr:rhomboid family intramembrane serine protease [Nocardioides daedukensis]NYG59067.1 membrane associated rhomboid family serine protease [Nocardioides daedukensis]
MSLEQRPETQTPRAVSAAVTIGSFVALLYVIEFVDMLMANRLDQQGIEPRETGGLLGIVFAPLLHGGWGHLIANTFPALVLGFLILLSGLRTWAGVSAVVWIIGGVGIWLTGGDNSVHIGASGLIFGWLTYLIVRGIFSRKVGQILLGVVILVMYGGLLWGVLPGQEGISWQGHLFGAVGGVIAAWLLVDRDSERR